MMVSKDDVRGRWCPRRMSQNEDVEEVVVRKVDVREEVVKGESLLL
jgi:hypothetical protein